MSYRDNERYRKVYSYFRPVPRPADPTYVTGVPKSYVDDLFNSLDWKQSVTYASTKNVNIAAVHTLLKDIDDHWGPADPDTLVDEDRVLLKEQTDPKENGLYIWYTATSLFVRSLDGVQDSLTCGATCYIDKGTHAGEVWVLETIDPITVDTSGQLWSFLVSISGSADTEVSFFTSSVAGYVSTTGSMSFNGGKLTALNTLDIGTDVFFYVSGSITGSGANDQKAVFGGDVVVSGSMAMKNAVMSGDLTVSGSSTLTSASLSGDLVVSGNTTLATAIFGGDVTLSGSLDITGDTVEITGSLFVSGTFDISGDIIEITGSFYTTGSAFTVTTDTMIVSGAVKATQGFSGSLTNLTDGTSYIAAGNNITVVSSSNGQVVIGAIVPYITGTWVDLGNSLATTSSVSIGSASLPTIVGTDVFFYVSGTTNLTGTSGKVSVFGGDLVVSGGVNLVGDIIEISGSLYVSGGVFDVMADTLEVTGTVIATAGMQVGGVSNASVGSDVFFFVSGSTDLTGSSGKVAVFGGDVRVSGSLTVGTGSVKITSNGIAFGNSFTLTATSGSSPQLTVGSGMIINGTVQCTLLSSSTGLTGSLTKLGNGTSYLAAGSNITITTGSTGQVTIAATAPASSGPSILVLTGTIAGGGAGTADLGAPVTLSTPGFQSFWFTVEALGVGGADDGKYTVRSGVTWIMLSGSTYTSAGNSGIGTAEFRGESLGYYPTLNHTAGVGGVQFSISNAPYAAGGIGKARVVLIYAGTPLTF